MFRNILLALLFSIPLSLDPLMAWGAVRVADSNISLASGVRADNLDWNISGTLAGDGPNVLSELSWEDLRSFQLRLTGSFELAVEGVRWFHPYFQTQFATGRIYAGENQDSDYDGDNRTDEFSRSNNAADRGNMLDFSLAAGQKIPLLNQRLNLIPLVGYSYRQQKLRLLDGFQSIPAAGPFPGLDSTYAAEWWGGWIGLEATYKTHRRLMIHGSASYHFAEFYAAGNWNLRTEFAHPISFEQTADATGWVQELGIEYLFKDNLSWTLSAIFQDWQTGAGIDRIFLADGTILHTRLNQANWESRSLLLGLNWKF